MTKPWERQKGESSKSFAWFEVYLDLGPNRKLKNVIEKIESMSNNEGKKRDSDENFIPILHISRWRISLIGGIGLNVRELMIII